MFTDSYDKCTVVCRYKGFSCCVLLQSSEDLRKEIASLEFEILRTEQYLLSLYRTAFDEQVSSFSPHTETSLVSSQFYPKSEQSDVTSVFSYQYQASPASERSSSCPPRSFQASLKALSARVSNTICIFLSFEFNQPYDETATLNDVLSILQEKTRYVSGNHTTLGDLMGSSHIVENVVNPSRLSEEILRCICSVYCTLSSKARTNSCLQASFSSPSSVSSKTTFGSWNPCLEESKKANVPRGVVIESLKLQLDEGSFSHAALMLQNFRYIYIFAYVTSE